MGHAWRWFRIALIGMFAAGVVVVTASAGNVTYSYDALGRLVQSTYSNGARVTYSLDAVGNRTAVTATAPTPPTVPSGLVATAASQTTINLSWSASTDVGGPGLGGYRVYRGGTQVGTTTSTSYSDTGLSGYTTYSYTVAAYDTAGSVSGQSGSASATTPDQTAPSAPSALSAASASSSQINLSWAASTDTGGSGLAGYRVYRGGTQVGTTSSTSYSDTGLSANTAYSYTVAAYDNAGNVSTQSNSANASTTPFPPPSTPTGLSATSTSQSQINLSWAASTDSGGPGLAGYRIYRGGTQIGTTASTSYNDTGLSGYTTYSYTVSAYDSAGNTSSPSSAVSATTPDQTVPSVPTGLSASAVSQSQINLSWSGATDAGGSGLAGYRVYRGGTQIGTTSSTAYSDTGLGGYTNYSYTVAAYDNAGNVSGQSTAAGATTPDQTAPGAPTGLSATAASNSQINLSWNASVDSGGSGVGGYRVYRGGIQIAATAATSFSDTGLTGNTTYSYTVTAYDNAGNASGQSNSASATTPVVTDGGTLIQGSHVYNDGGGYWFMAGYYPTNSPPYYVPIGSYSPITLSGGKTLRELFDSSYCAYCKGPKAGTNAWLAISGFASDPGASWLVSVSSNGVTLTPSTATYSYSGGTAAWSWAGGQHFAFLGNSKSTPTTIVHQ